MTQFQFAGSSNPKAAPASASTPLRNNRSAVTRPPLAAGVFGERP